MYSQSDQFLDGHSLERAIERRRELGRAVRTFVVREVEHVRLIQKFRERYMQTVLGVSDRGVRPDIELVGMDGMDDWPQGSKAFVQS